MSGECRYCREDAVGVDALGRPACEQHIDEVADDTRIPVAACCSKCGQPWHQHYDPKFLKYKNGPFGAFGLVADHTPHIPGVHAERES